MHDNPVTIVHFTSYMHKKEIQKTTILVAKNYFTTKNKNQCCRCHCLKKGRTVGLLNRPVEYFTASNYKAMTIIITMTMIGRKLLQMATFNERNSG